MVINLVNCEVSSPIPVTSRVFATFERCVDAVEYSMGIEYLLEGRRERRYTRLMLFFAKTVDVFVCFYTVSHFNNVLLAYY